MWVLGGRKGRKSNRCKVNLDVSAAESKIMATKKKKGATTQRRATLCREKGGRNTEHSSSLWERKGLEVQRQEGEAEVLLQGSHTKLPEITDFLIITKPSEQCIIQLCEIYACFLFSLPVFL